MRFFVKAIATGFAMSMGSAIFKKVSKKMGLEGEDAEKDAEAPKVDADAESDTEGETPESAPETPPETESL